MSIIRPTSIAEFLHPISTYVAPLSGFIDLSSFVGGTAVIIAPGLAITASHVFDEFLTQFGSNRTPHNINLDLYINQLNTGACWFVCHASSWVGTDITVLSLKARNEVARSTSISRLPMTVDPPEPGTQVTALGYPKSKLTITQNDEDILKMNFDITPTVSEGNVIEVHRTHRDSVLLPFPCFSVNAEFTAGMSGGAVFNQKRQLCGLVCTGGKGELKDHSYATSIWPTALIPVTIPDGISPFAGITPGGKFKFLDLAKLKYILLDGHERIEFFKHKNGSDGVRRNNPQ